MMKNHGRTEGFRHRENQMLEEVKEYIRSGYSQHYVDGNPYACRDVVDDWVDMNIVEDACVSNILKYIKRYGKKDGKNRKDIHKAIHYALILLRYTIEDIDWYMRNGESKTNKGVVEYNDYK